MGRGYARRLSVVAVPATLLAGLLVPLDATAAGATVQAQVTGTSAGVVTVSPEANQADVSAEASVGRSITLKAAASGLRTAWWILVDRPLQSGTRIGTTQATETTMQLDVPGSYSVEAAIAWQAGVFRSTVTISVTERGPLVPFDSVNYDASRQPGVLIGSQRYAMSAGGSLQVVAVDRRNLELLGNRSFTADATGITAGTGYIATFPATALVIVTNPAGWNNDLPRVQPADLGRLNLALARIGAAHPSNWYLNSDYASCWAGRQDRCTGPGWQERTGVVTPFPFSFAGVPGMALGQAWSDLAFLRGTRDGRLAGYLTAASSVDDPEGPNAYTLVRGADAYARVDTCASGSPATACVIQVGAASYAPPPAANGVWVVELGRSTLSFRRQTVATTASDLTRALRNTINTNPGHEVVTGLTDQTVVILQSVGSGRLSGGDTDILPFIEQLGGTVEAFTAAVTTGQPYSLVGVANDLPWRGAGAESSPVIEASQAGFQRLELVRDRDGRFTPQIADPVGIANLDLYGILYQNLTPWSYAASPVLPYLAGPLALPADVRSAYANRAVDFASKLALLLSLQCPANHDALGFTCADFTAVQNQLKFEFDGVQSVRVLLDALKQPFLQSGQTQQFAVQEIAAQIQASLQAPGTSPTKWSWLKQLSYAMSLAASLARLVGQPALGGAFGLLATAASVGYSELTSTSNGAQAPDITAAVNQLNARLAKHNLAQVESLGLIELILVADQGKLLTVRTKAGTDPAWRWTQATASNAVNSLNAAARAATYTALMPLAWPLWVVQPSSNPAGPSSNTTPCTGREIDPVGGTRYIVTYPFQRALPANQFPAVTAWTGTGLSTQLWTFARMSNFSRWYWNNPSRNTTLPGASLTAKIFSLGGDGAGQYAPRWYRQTYNPPDRAVCVPDRGDSALALAARGGIVPANVMVR